jgi:indoleamine 2,3-dioxygenase
MDVLSTKELMTSELVLRRAHHVLAWVMHFYIHSLPPSEPVVIPAPITVPLLQICQQLRLPPVLTYSDDVLYNWALKTPLSDPTPALDNLRCNTLFTSTRDEEEFYLVSARMEIRGVEALDLMKLTMDELFVGDDIAVKRVTEYLDQIAIVLQDLKRILLTVREGCDPKVFYNEIRPWFRGMDSKHSGSWTFEGIGLDPTLQYPEELSGPSAGQSSLIHSLDIFLGVDRYSHSSSITGGESAASSSSSSSSTAPASTVTSKKAFLSRMQLYMPRHHRNFLNHLAATPRPLRDFVETSKDSEYPILDAYNAAVIALKQLRDAHLIIVTQYIVGPARQAEPGTLDDTRIVSEFVEGDGEDNLKGTGGTNLMKFLKDVRNGTAGAVLPNTTA